jgi:hypothetical protein
LIATTATLDAGDRKMILISCRRRTLGLEMIRFGVSTRVTEIPVLESTGRGPRRSNDREGDRRKELIDVDAPGLPSFALAFDVPDTPPDLRAAASEVPTR